MLEEKKIKTWSASDIEKYWSGKLSNAEMHALEKAAMDDPFLADALEGYKNAADATAELDSLHKKLETKIGNTAKVVPIGNKKIPWLRVAVAVIIIGGIGVLAQQVLQKKENETIVKAEEKKVPPTAEINQLQKTDTISENKADSKAPLITNATIEQSGTASAKTQQFDLTVIDSLRETEISEDKQFKNLDTEKKTIETAPPVVKALTKSNDVTQNDDAKSKLPESLALNEKKENAGAAKPKKDTEAFTQDKKNAYQLNNRYNYRVVDEQNNPVPFANVFNTRDNVGTYTDIKGNFNLISSDSLLDVQVRSLGYTADNFRLVTGNANATLILKEDDRTQILVENNRRVSNNVARKDSAVLEEPEVGWGYYNTYVSNNIKIPDNIRSKINSNDVELSFDIDKTGSPINIRVTRSSGCKECDEEAKRLLKDGPKWKRKGKKAKGSVVINVDK
jgi:TonB family protein